MKKILLSFFIGVMLIACNQKTVFVREVWTKEQANEWYKQWGWLLPGEPDKYIRQIFRQ